MDKQALVASLVAQVSPDRLRDLTLDLVKIPSPTGEAVEVSEFYADHVQHQLGLGVEIVRDFPHSPSTVARWERNPAGRTLTLDGHLDTIHAAHAAPYFENGRIYGRGAGDMKSGVAAMVEATRVLMENEAPLNGNLNLFTHTLHEAPIGHMEALKAILKRGDVFRDAAIVAESGYDSLYIRGKGQSLFEITITRSGEVLHENVARPQGVPNPLDYAAELCHRIVARDRELAPARDELLGAETFFLGQIHGGDFYNRVPTRAFINGIHRFWPDKEWADIDREFERLLATVEWHPDLKVDCQVAGNGLGYDVDPQADIVRSLRAGYQQIVGRELPLVGGLSVCDVNVIAREGGIPAVSHGTGATTSHADVEWVELDGIVRCTQIFIATIIDYLGIRE